MPFIDLPDGRGKLYVPQPPQGRRKRPCPDCFACQWCSDERCAVCRPARQPLIKPHETVPDGCH
jgi:hypothetical protein